MNKNLLVSLFFTLSLLFTVSCSTLGRSEAIELSQEYQKYSNSAYYLKVRGMVCGACVDGLNRELRKDNRIEDVDIDLEKEEVFIKTSATSIEIKQLILRSLQIRGLDLLSILQK